MDKIHKYFQIVHLNTMINSKNLHFKMKSSLKRMKTINFQFQNKINNNLLNLRKYRKMSKKILYSVVEIN